MDKNTVEGLKTRRGYIKATVSRIASFCERISQTTTNEAIQLRLDKLNNSWTEFYELQNELAQFATDLATGNLENENEQFETKYYAVKEILLETLNARQVSPSNNNSEAIDRLLGQQTSFFERFSSTLKSSNNSNITADTKLPKLELPVFSGNYNEWISFRDLFVATVHDNARLTPSQKLNYLKTFLKGDAAALLRHVMISDSNYEQAWERLNQRYDKKGQIAKSFIKSFMALPSITTTSPSGLRKLSDGTDEIIRGLQALGPEAETRDPWIIYLLLSKIDPVTRQDWAEESADDEFPAIDKLLKFLNRRCQALEDSQVNGRHIASSSSKQASSNSSAKIHTTSLEHCPKCTASHLLCQCSAFKSMDIELRRKFVNEKKLCFNCLRPGHTSLSCKSKHVCRTCKRKHHSLVHLESQSSLQNQNQSTNQIASTSNVDSDTSLPKPIVNAHASSVHKSLNLSCLLPTALVNVEDHQGNLHICRVLLDCGSQATFVTSALIRKLRLPRKRARIAVSGVSGVNGGTTKGLASLKMVSRLNNERIDVDSYILTSLTSKLPNTKFEPLIQFKSLELADPFYNIPSSIDIILGAEKMFHILEPERFIVTNGLIAQLTKFGWVVAGRLPWQSSDAISTNLSPN